MVADQKLFKFLLFLIVLPLGLAIFGGDRFRYPCQDPKNWDKQMCKFPDCDVTRTCPEHVFKGQRDPRLGPPRDGQTQTTNQSFAPAGACTVQQTQGANCGK